MSMDSSVGSYDSLFDDDTVALCASCLDLDDAQQTVLQTVRDFEWVGQRKIRIATLNVSLKLSKFDNAQHTVL